MHYMPVTVYFCCLYHVCRVEKLFVSLLGSAWAGDLEENPVMISAGTSLNALWLHICCLLVNHHCI